MIFVLELPPGAAPRCWFAFDGDDLRRKLAATGGPPDWPMHLWRNEPSAVLAMEDDALPLWQGPEGWKARWALRAQLVATEVVSEE